MNLATRPHQIDVKEYRANILPTYLRSFIGAALFLSAFSALFEASAAAMGFMWAFGLSSIAYLVGLPLGALNNSSASAIKKASPKSFEATRKYECSDKGLRQEISSGSFSFTMWEDFISAARTKSATRIFYSKDHALFIPDSAWPSPNERDQFVALLKDKSLLK